MSVCQKCGGYAEAGQDLCASCRGLDVLNPEAAASTPAESLTVKSVSDVTGQETPEPKKTRVRVRRCASCGEQVLVESPMCQNCGAEMSHHPAIRRCKSCGTGVLIESPKCQNCGAELPPHPPITRCASCGTQVLVESPTCQNCGAAMPPPPVMIGATKLKRPIGITLLGVIGMLAGIAMLFIAVMMILPSMLGALLPAGMDLSYLLAGQPVWAAGVMLVPAIVALVLAVGLLKGMRWARTIYTGIQVIVLILSVIGVVSSVLELTGVFSVGSLIDLSMLAPVNNAIPGGMMLYSGVLTIICALITYYMLRPSVKAYFSKK